MLAALLAVRPALAHPHVWVDMKEEVLFNKEGRITGIRNAWTFDEMYSAFALQGLEKDGKPASAKDLAPLAETNIKSLTEFDYFTYAKNGGAKLKFASPVDYSLEEGPNKRVILHFTLPLVEPIKVTRFFTFQIYDPSFFVDFEFQKDDPIAITNEPSGCSLSVLGPNPLVVQDGMKVAQTFDSGIAPGEDFALKMASRAVVACP